MIEKTNHYIGGQWRPSSGSETITVINPATEQPLAVVSSGTKEDLHQAALAAHDAFPAWSQSSLEERKRVLTAISEGIMARAPEFAQTISSELGMPIGPTSQIQVPFPAAIIASYCGIIDEFPFEEKVGNCLIDQEPIGVCGLITPWNFPLHQIAIKVAPAIAAGCTVVLKPSEMTPLTAHLFAEVVDASGLPPGVFNMVVGTGPVVGEAMTASPLIDMISFTGSTGAGKRVSEVAAQTVKRVSLELGGKSASILLDDADFSQAVPGAVGLCMTNSGQFCGALSRMLVPRSRLTEAEAIAKAVAEGMPMGDPMAETSFLGPVISAAQKERVVRYIQKGLEDGAVLLTGGTEAPEDLPTGYYVRPTIFTGANNQMTIAREEVFGPVLTIIPYEDEADAIAIANDSPYGLWGGVFSADTDRAVRVARQIRTGQVAINGSNFDILAPFGGFKQSGHGREIGVDGLREYLAPRALLMNPPPAMAEG
jgi:acyl-CoA reductase-like NAD-dependent aldehyde dehydrogenase